MHASPVNTVIEFCGVIGSVGTLLPSVRRLAVDLKLHTGTALTSIIQNEDSRCLVIWSEWMSQQTPGEFCLQFPRVSGEGQLGDPTPPGWPL